MTEMLLEGVVLIFVITSVPALVYALQKLTVPLGTQYLIDKLSMMSL